MADRCTLTDLQPEQCAHCQGSDATPTTDLVAEVTITARYDSNCGICGKPTIREGEPLYGVRETPGGQVTWAGPCCVLEA